MNLRPAAAASGWLEAVARAETGADLVEIQPTISSRYVLSAAPAADVGGAIPRGPPDGGLCVEGMLAGGGFVAERFQVAVPRRLRKWRIATSRGLARLPPLGGGCWSGGWLRSALG